MEHSNSFFAKLKKQCRTLWQWAIQYALVRFLLVGGSGLILNICIVYALRHYIHVVLARTLSYLVAFSFTWLLNRSFTFHSHDPKKIQQWLRYAAIYISTGALHIGSFALLIHQSVFLQQNPIWAIILSAACIAILNFSLSRRFAFKIKSI